MGRMPVARGSSVPPWPALAALNRRRTLPTACVEVTPDGLSMISQPLTGSPLRLRAIARPDFTRAPPWLGFCGRREIASHPRIVQQFLDPVGLLEGGIGGEADRGRHPQIDLVRQLGPEVAAGVIERRHQFRR